MENIQINKIAEQAECLFDKARTIITNSENEDVKVVKEQIPHKFMDEGSMVKIVFCGQYSAGKSTILSLLTGVDLEISGKVCTSEVKELNWNGIKVYDTPGIHTQNHPDHDKITYDAISKSDLLIFVLTNEGFSDHLGAHFRNLVFDMKKGREMMLVVNKMESDAQGNCEEARKRLLDTDIAKVIAPLSGEDLYTSFVDAGSYLNYLEHDEYQDFYLEQSNFSELVSNINKFVKDKGLLGKYTNNLHRLEHLLEDALAKYRSGNEFIDSSIVVLDSKIAKYNDTINKISSDLHNLKNLYHSKYVKEGDTVADKVTEKSKEADINSNLITAQDKVNSLLEKMQEEAIKIISSDLSELDKELVNLKDSQFVKNLQASISKGLANNIKVDPELLKKASGVVDKIGKIGEELSKLCLKEGANNLAHVANASGSQAHKVILAVGHLFGKSFKPWEAVKYAQTLGQVGKIVGIAGGLLGPVLQGWSDCQENKQAQQLSEARLSIRNTFAEQANVIDMRFDERTQTWIQENIQTEIDECNREKQELRKKIENKNDEQKQLEDVLANVRVLIDQVQNLQYS